MQLKKTVKKITYSDLLMRGFLFSLLLAVCLVLSYFYINSTSGVTILIHNHSYNDFTKAKTTELYKGETLDAQFEAKDNYLGIISVRFNTFFRINSDSVTFRLKEKGAKNWYYEHSYLTNQFQPDKFFTFGFPVIADSSQKYYEFEIESDHGTPGDAVALSPIEPTFVSKYQYPKQRILHDKQFLVTFLINKTVNSLEDIDFLISLIVYALPLLLYVIKLFFFDKYFADKYLCALIPIVAMVVLCFINVPRNDEAVIGAVGLWIVLSLTYRLRSSISYLFSLVFILISIVLLYLHILVLAKNLAMWGYMMIVAAITLDVIRIRFPTRNLQGIRSVIFHH